MNQSEIDKSIRLTTQTIMRETSQIFSDKLAQLREDAPETTPENIGTVIWASSDFVKDDFLKKDISPEKIYYRLLEELLELYLDNNYVTVRKSQSLILKDEAIKINADTRKSGVFSPRTNSIWMYLEDSKVEDLCRSIKEELMESNINIPRELVSQLAEFPEFYQNRFFDVNEETGLSAVLAHEITHLYMKRNTKIGKLLLEHTENDQARKIGAHPEISAIDEIFAFYVSHIYGQDVLERGDFHSTGFSGYGRKKGILINQGLRILDQKVEETRKRKDEKILDWLRKFEISIMEEIANNGLLSESKDPEANRAYNYFLKACVPRYLKRAFQETREVIEEDLKPAFKLIKEGITKLEKENIEADMEENLEELKGLEKQMDWKNPEKTEQKIFEEWQYVYQAQKVGTDEEFLKEKVNQNLADNLKAELEKLEDFREKLKKLYKKHGQNDKFGIPEELVEGYKMLEKTEKEINQIKGSLNQ